MKNLDTVRLMIHYIVKIEEYCKNSDYNSFSQNTLLSDACVFNLSQIGELTTRLEPDFLLQNTEIPWHQIKGLRNKIVHDYEGINLMLVWEVISEDLPVLKKQLESII